MARSEKATGFRNAALANFMKSFGVLQNPVDFVLGTYFHHCAIAMTCRQLALAGRFLAHSGRNPDTGCSMVSPERARRINALMLTCGHYDGSGEFAYRVGLPGKSGVGGGILAVAPGQRLDRGLGARARLLRQFAPRPPRAGAVGQAHEMVDFRGVAPGSIANAPWRPRRRARRRLMAPCAASFGAPKGAANGKNPQALATCSRRKQRTRARNSRTTASPSPAWAATSLNNCCSTRAFAATSSGASLGLMRKIASAIL